MTGLMQQRLRQKFWVLVQRDSIYYGDAQVLLDVWLLQGYTQISIQSLTGEVYVPWRGKGRPRGRHCHPPTPKLSKPSLNPGIISQCYLVQGSKGTIVTVGIPKLICIIFICREKYCGPWLRSARQERSIDCMENPIMNIFSELGIRVARGGSDCLVVMSDEVIVTRSSVSMTMLKKPPAMTQTMASERIPPVRVLYCVSALQRRSSDEQNMSSLQMRPFRVLRANIMENQYKIYRKCKNIRTRIMGWSFKMPDAVKWIDA